RGFKECEGGARQTLLTRPVVDRSRRAGARASPSPQPQNVRRVYRPPPLARNRPGPRPFVWKLRAVEATRKPGALSVYPKQKPKGGALAVSVGRASVGRTPNVFRLRRTALRGASPLTPID